MTTEVGTTEFDPPGRRRYDNSRRAAQAGRTRDRVFRAAFALFGEHGYARTTLGAIAEHADVPLETVRKIGSKRDLLDGARLVGVFDTDQLDGILAADFMQDVARAASFPEAVGVLVDFYAVSNARASAFWEAWQGAALQDPAVAEAWRDEMASAHDAFRTGVRYARSRGWLRPDVDDEELAATLWVLVSTETHRRLTRDAGLDGEAYRRWLRRALLDQMAPQRLRPDHAG
ncbi:helix-turn-helix domain-containing protein [Nocardioides zeae]|uniref:Helix-turn-helix domain-containing protein n=1 Tax=Nocardioides imazamoxiresistens TaxID=3231893 RepID=A0ABU3PWC1_9ACTN|nr:helix-turn-helix domain-containing protein [Nocardioides zeae]MDT9593545.1 helix-turn-helix domain-containing protein [Nocardioides zeae]